jgi:hypothetical protein
VANVSLGLEITPTFQEVIMSNGSRAFAVFMASTAGRLLRIVAGVALIAWGWSTHETTTAVSIMLLGFVPLLAGVFNVCLIAPIIGAPFAGKDALRIAGGGGSRR